MNIYRTYIRPALAGSLVFIFVFLSVMLFRWYVLDRFRVDGPSMEPLYTDGEMVWVNRLDRTPEYGKVVVVDNGGYNIVKRIVGLPGDSLEIKEGKVYINGEPESGDYPETGPEMSVTVEEGKVFVLGDNRPESEDSRSSIGQVPVENIAGTPVFN